MGLSVCFLLGELGPSGGVRAVVEHARRLADRHGMTVALVVSETTDRTGVPGIESLSLPAARGREWDVAVATWWRTALDLFSIPARRRAYFVQQLDDRVYRPGEVERLGAALTHDLPVAFVTEARWIADQLAELRADASCHHVPNGVDKSVFAPLDRTPAPDGPLRVTVEGSPHLWFKGVEDAARVLEHATAPLSATLVSPERAGVEVSRAFHRVLGPLDHPAMAAVFDETDVVLKLSRVEGMFTPPLEAFHRGATCVVWPVTGHDDYVRHGLNGVVVDFDDIQGTAGWIDLLHRDRGLLARLRSGALDTARAWPSWDEAGDRMAAALTAISEASPPSVGAGAAALLADLDAGMEELRAGVLRREREAAQTRQAAEDWVAAIRSTRTFRVQRLLSRLLASVRR